MKKIVINGKFMSQTVTGVQRYAREILLELDKILDDNVNIEILINSEAKDVPEYKNIKIVRYGKLKGNLWEQTSLPYYVLKNRAICLNLCNMTPILTPHIVVTHDVSFKVNPDFFSWKFKMWYNFIYNMSISRIKKIITVSEFSKSEICKAYKKEFKNITVIYNAWQHFERIDFDENALNKYKLPKKKYYFAMISMAPNKNFKWIAENARKNPDNIYAVSGSINKKVFGSTTFDFEIPKNLMFLGYVSDEEAKTLLRDCKAFLYPTFYEGFGIPPLETLSLGTKAIVSDASCMREVYGNAVYYIDPYNPYINLDKLIEGQVEPSESVIGKYSWKKSAEKLLEVLRK